MPEGALPFRPRDEQGRSADDVLSQVRRCRRRANAVAAQHALYSTAAWSFAAVSSVVVLAFLLPSGLYAAAVWLAVVGLAVAITRSVGDTRRRWIPRVSAAVEVDRRARLEERLATLAAYARSPRQNRLWDVLVRDNLRLLPDWTPRRLVPRALPGSFWVAVVLLLVTLALLQVSNLLPAEDGFFPRLAAGRAAPNAPSFGPESERSSPDERAPDRTAGLVDLSSILNALPERLREEILRRAKKAPPGSKPPPGSQPIARGRSGGTTGEGAAPDAAGQAASGDARDATAGGGEGGGDPSNAPEVAPHSGRGRHASIPQKLLPPVKGDGLKRLARPGTPSDGKARELAAQLAGAGAGAGAGSGRGAGSLLGPRESGDAGASSFPLDLDGKTEDRRGDRDGEPGDPSRPESALAAEQLADDAVRRAQVPPEYEAIVKRIFRREEAAEPIGVPRPPGVQVPEAGPTD